MKNNKKKWAIIFYSTFIGISAVVIIAVFSIIILPSSGGDNVSDNVIATVNGIPIYKKEIDAGLPKDAFGPSLKYMRKSKLDNLIYTAIVKQFIEHEKIRIEDQRVDRQVEYLKKYPTGNYSSLIKQKIAEISLVIDNRDYDELLKLSQDNNIERIYSYVQYLEKHPKGQHIDEVEQLSRQTGGSERA